MRGASLAPSHSKDEGSGEEGHQAPTTIIQLYRLLNFLQTHIHPHTAHTHSCPAMKTLPSLLPLLVAVATESGSSLTTALAHLCNYEYRVIENDTFVATGISHLSNYLYIRPEPGFEGVSMTVGTTDGEKYTAFFPKQDKCFQHQADWWQILMESWPYNYTSDNTNHHGLYFRMWTSGCPRLCYHTAIVNEVVDANITIYGPSAWKNNPPDSRCKTVMIMNNYDEERVPCRSYKSTEGDNMKTGPVEAKHPVTPASTRPTTTASSISTIFPESLTVSLMVVLVPGIALTLAATGTLRLVLVLKERKKKRTAARPTV
ncbi:hypothetical protein E2C01_042135 [Portunus trituberculatus]|uniref:Uncharacterized protein n=1 Tax=Portunus trituberculatus TaxID=210409 RepID=A0A5B7FST5_PORTR|nr:hypothetical protein [Portunus trituberculatus]